MGHTGDFLRPSCHRADWRPAEVAGRLCFGGKEFAAGHANLLGVLAVVELGRDARGLTGRVWAELATWEDGGALCGRKRALSCIGPLESGAGSAKVAATRNWPDPKGSDRARRAAEQHAERETGNWSLKNFAHSSCRGLARFE